MKIKKKEQSQRDPIGHKDKQSDSIDLGGLLVKWQKKFDEFAEKEESNELCLQFIYAGQAAGIFQCMSDLKKVIKPS